MKLTLLILGFCFSLLFGDIENNTPEAKYPFYSGEVNIVPSQLESDSIQLVCDTAGNPLFFSREVFTEACETGVCFPIRITLFWDYSGSFLGFSVPEDFPLTKAGHKEFSDFDYFQLYTLLNHPDSKISKFTKKDLVKMNENSKDKPDAVSGATVQVAKEEVVSGAAFTCIELWNKVNRNSGVFSPANFNGAKTYPELEKDALQEKLNTIKKLSVGELAVLLKQAQGEKLLRKFSMQMSLTKQLDELSPLHCLIISNYLNREDYLYLEARTIFKKNEVIRNCFSAMINAEIK